METNSFFLTSGQIEKKFQEAGIGLKETLALIQMTWEQPSPESNPAPSGRLFNNLDRLTFSTVKGTRINQFKANGPDQPFQVFEVNTPSGDVLAYLNMLYLRKPLPCYYLVYVEVASSFRGKGLGNRILQVFRDFVETKGTLGLLDNIIPPEDPTFDLYTKLGWLPLEALIEVPEGLDRGHYMVYNPSIFKKELLKLKLPKLIFNLEKKRPVIEMRDNELMVRRTIEEFQDIYRALERLFQKELETGRATPLMRFMFTKFTTKLLGFQRRIQELVGYTGGESLEQLSLSPQVRALFIQPFNFDPERDDFQLSGEEHLWKVLPPKIKNDSTRAIEKLPLYQRPFLKQWMADNKRSEPLKLTIADLLDLGFDPTRLREFWFEQQGYMFERTTPSLLREVETRKGLLQKMSRKARGLRIGQTQLKVNPPLLWLKDRGNGYILRRKIEAIHWEEATYQLKQNAGLQFLNQNLHLDKRIVKIIQDIKDWGQLHIRSSDREMLHDLAYFVPWNLEKNRPLFSIDDNAVPYLESLWVA